MRRCMLRLRLRTYKLQAGALWRPWHLVESSSSRTQVWPKPALTARTSWLSKSTARRLEPSSEGSSPRLSELPCPSLREDPCQDLHTCMDEQYYKAYRYKTVNSTIPHQPQSALTSFSSRLGKIWVEGWCGYALRQTGSCFPGCNIQRAPSLHLALLWSPN